MPRVPFWVSSAPVRSRTPQGRFPPARLLHPGGRCGQRFLMCAAGSRPHGVIQPAQGASNKDLAFPARRTKGDTFLEGVAMAENQRNEQKNDARHFFVRSSDFRPWQLLQGMYHLWFFGRETLGLYWKPPGLAG